MLETLRRLAPPVEPASHEVVSRARGFRARRRRRPALLVAPAAALAALVVVLTHSGGPSFAAEAVRAAEGSPRVLADGWKVTRVDEWNAGQGEMTFASGARTLELSWWPARAAGALGKDSERVHARGRSFFRYRGTNDYTAFWRSGGAIVEARALAASPDAFAALLSSLHAVDAETWLRALPASAVAPSQNGATVASMLRGLPLPPGFVAPHDAGTRDRYQLGAQVAGAVACGWIEVWLHGDRAAAVRALGTARSWPVLLSMQSEGDYPKVLWEYADAVVNGTPVIAGKPLSVEESYREALGC